MNNFEPKDFTVRQSIDEPIREGLTHDEEWHREDDGYIFCWETGRRLALEEPTLANKAKLGELPVLSWKGGYQKALQTKKCKYGTFRYLATLQGLRGEDLWIDFRAGEGHKKICTATNMCTLFTSNIENLKD